MDFLSFVMGNKESVLSKHIAADLIQTDDKEDTVRCQKEGYGIGPGPSWATLVSFPMGKGWSGGTRLH